MAFGSNRPTGMWLRLQAPAEKVVVEGEQVPNGSRTKPVVVATLPDTGSTVPATTVRVVARPNAVPSGDCRPTASPRTLPGWMIPERLEEPMVRYVWVGTVAVKTVPCT